ncbi:ATPase [Clostridium sp.]|uniref:ATPase n=1 Tax=Clostridium sp. TaxID=1506 RepID=UPI002A91DBBD|nr:ATPase [Clostridium sp.]MDY6012883.1 ATPase [Clostridium sp.]
MNRQETNVIEILEYLQERLEDSPKVPMSGKVMVDKREFMDILDDIINNLPDQFKKSTWVMKESDRIIAEAKKEAQSLKEEALEIARQNLENHDFSKEAKIRGQEILAAANREAKNMRIGARNYADEILSELDRELEKRKMELIKSLQVSFEDTAKEIDENLTKACSVVKENIRELREIQ